MPTHERAVRNDRRGHWRPPPTLKTCPVRRKRDGFQTLCNADCPERRSNNWSTFTETVPQSTVSPAGAKSTGPLSWLTLHGPVLLDGAWPLSGGSARTFWSPRGRGHGPWPFAADFPERVESLALVNTFVSPQFRHRYPDYVRDGDAPLVGVEGIVCLVWRESCAWCGGNRRALHAHRSGVVRGPLSDGRVGDAERRDPIRDDDHRKKEGPSDSVSKLMPPGNCMGTARRTVQSGREFPPVGLHRLARGSPMNHLGLMEALAGHRHRRRVTHHTGVESR